MPTPRSDAGVGPGAGPGVGAGAGADAGAKLAVTLAAALIVTVQVVDDPEQASLQPVNVDPALGAAARVTVDPTGSDALWVVRPGEASRAPWCADLLLRTGSFALVVLDGAPVLPRAVAVRLSQLTRDADASLLLLGEGSRASEIGGALRLVLKRRDPRTVLATVEKGGPHQHIPLQVEGGHGRDIARRVCAHPEVPDRRGAARTGTARRRARR
jgi:hypothetical protein